jgi:heptosyltransferase-2
MYNKRFFCKNKLLYLYLFSVDIFSSIFFVRKKQIDIKRLRSRTSEYKLLIANNGHLGDIVLLISAVQELKREYPNISVSLVTGSWNKVLLSECDMFDNVIYFSHWKLNRSCVNFFHKIYITFFSFMTAIRKIIKLKFDIAIDTYHFYPNSALLIFLSGIKYSLGWTSGGYSNLYVKSKVFKLENRNVANYHIDILSELYPKLSYVYNLNPFITKDLTQLDTDVIKKLVPDDYCVIHPGSGDHKKQWSIDKWKKIIHLLAPKYRKLYITGAGVEEDSIAQELCVESNVVILVNKLSLKGFSHVLSHASLLVSLDSFAAHLASQYNVKNVIISTLIHPEILWKPLNDNAYIVRSENLPCSICHFGCSSMNCIRMIKSDDVYNIIVHLIDRD